MLKYEINAETEIKQYNIWKETLATFCLTEQTSHNLDNCKNMERVKT